MKISELGKGGLVAEEVQPGGSAGGYRGLTGREER